MSFFALYADVLALLHAGNLEKYRFEAMLFPAQARVVCMPPIIEQLCMLTEMATTFSVLTRCMALYEYYSMLMEPTYDTSVHKAFATLPAPTSEEQVLRFKIAPLWIAARDEFNVQKEGAFIAEGVTDEQRYLRLVNLYEGLFFAATAYMQDSRPDMVLFEASFRSVSCAAMPPRTGAEIKALAKFEHQCVLYNEAQVHVAAEFTSRKRRQENHSKVMKTLKQHAGAD